MELPAPASLTKSCPNCDVPYPVFLTEVCPHCKADFAGDKQRYPELLQVMEQLVKGLEILKTTPFPSQKLNGLQPLFDSLTLYAKDWQELQEWRQLLIERFVPFVVKADKQRNTLVMHSLILCILCIIPFIALWFQVAWVTVGLLLLPALGWLWLGIFAYLREERKKYEQEVLE